jgi:hypothetical protein
MNSRVSVDDVPTDALEVSHKETGEVLGWIWEEESRHSLGGTHWRFAVKLADQAYVTPFGFLSREFAAVRVAVIKGVVSHHTHVQGD